MDAYAPAPGVVAIEGRDDAGFGKPRQPRGVSGGMSELVKERRASHAIRKSSATLPKKDPQQLVRTRVPIGSLDRDSLPSGESASAADL